MWTGLVMLIVLRLPNPTSAEWMQLGRHDSGTNHTELPLPAENEVDWTSSPPKGANNPTGLSA